SASPAGLEGGGEGGEGRPHRRGPARAARRAGAEAGCGWQPPAQDHLDGAGGGSAMTSGRSLTLAQLRSHVADIRKRVPDARLSGLHVATGGEGGDRLDCDGQNYAVVRADTVLALREALLEAEARPQPTVLLTALDEAELGLDARARLAKGRLIP